MCCFSLSTAVSGVLLCGLCFPRLSLPVNEQCWLFLSAWSTYDSPTERAHRIFFLQTLSFCPSMSKENIRFTFLLLGTSLFSPSLTVLVLVSCTLPQMKSFCLVYFQGVKWLKQLLSLLLRNSAALEATFCAVSWHHHLGRPHLPRFGNVFLSFKSQHLPGILFPLIWHSQFSSKQFLSGGAFKSPLFPCCFHVWRESCRWSWCFLFRTSLSCTWWTV